MSDRRGFLGGLLAMMVAPFVVAKTSGVSANGPHLHGAGCKRIGASHRDWHWACSDGKLRDRFPCPVTCGYERPHEHPYHYEPGGIEDYRYLHGGLVAPRPGGRRIVMGRGGDRTAIVPAYRIKMGRLNVHPIKIGRLVFGRRFAR